MIALIVFLFCIFAALGTGVLASVSDYNGLKIPNLYSVIVLGLFPLCYGALWVLGDTSIFQSLSSHALSMLIFFIVTLIMFSLGILGAADSKIGSAFALWVGLQGLFGFLFYMTLMGALLALIALILKKKPFVKNAKPDSWIDTVQKGGNKVPYGIAITAGAFAAFYDLGYLDIYVLADAFDL